MTLVRDMSTIKIREACIEDIEQISDIYSYYVLNSLSTLEENPPSLEEMRGSFTDNTQKNLPFIVAHNNGEIVGYAYAKPYRTRSGYRFTVEESVYIKNGFQRKGIGKKLLIELIDKLKINRFKQVIAIITIANESNEKNSPSLALHESCGFKKAGHLQNIGLKLNKVMDSIIMQCYIA